MRKFLLVGLLFTQQALAGGYYYSVPANPQPLQYLLPPAYFVPPPVYYAPPPVYIQPIQRGYVPPPPEGWGNSKSVPMSPRIDLLPNN